MKVIIPAGGKGTRLNTILKGLPKPLVNIDGDPLLIHTIRQCKKYGLTDINLLLGYKPNQIINALGDGTDLDVKITYHLEDKELGTAGAVKNIEDIIDSDFLLIYGDIYVNMNFEKLINFHDSKNSNGTLVCHPNNHPHDSDLLEVNDEDEIIDFISKPHDEGKYHRNLVNAGVSILNKSILIDIKKNTYCDFGKDIYPKFIGKKLYGYNTPEYIHDIGTPTRYKNVLNDINNNLPEKINLKNKRKAFFIDRDGTINKYIPFIDKIEDFELLEDVDKAIRAINSSEWLAIVITNQPQVARGQLEEEDVKYMHKKMEYLLGLKSAKLDAIYFCPHHPDKGFDGENKIYKIVCNCRKPKPGLYLKAQDAFNIDLSQSVYIGDTTRDIAVTKEVGGTSILLRCGLGGEDKKYDVEPDFMCNNLYSAVKTILEPKDK